MTHLIQLRTFLEAYRFRSLSRAAARLNITQPAASLHVKSVETLVGKPLFVRTVRGLTPTAVADELVQRIGSSFDELEAQLAGFKAHSGELTGVVHLVGPAEYVGVRVAPLLLPLMEKRIQVRIQSGNRDFIYQSLRSAAADLAFTASRPSSAGIGYAVLGVEQLKLVVSANYAKSFGRSLNPEKLQHIPLLAYDAELPLIREVMNQAFKIVANYTPAILVPDLRAIATMLRAGMGWSVLPDYLCDDDIRAGQLLAPKLPQPCTPNSLYLAWNKSALRQPRVIYVRDFLLRQFGVNAK